MIADVLVTIASFVALIPCLWFIVGYWVVTGGAWRREEAGVFMMSYAIIMALLFTIGIVGNWYQAQWMTIAAVLVFLGLVAIMWWPLRLLYRAQRERDQKHRETAVDGD